MSSSLEGPLADSPPHGKLQVVSSNVIQVQLPGGELYAPALVEAASKTVDRSGLSKRKANAATSLVELAIDTLNSASAASITLKIDVVSDGVSVTVTGTGCGSPSQAAVKRLAKAGTTKARTFDHQTNNATMTVAFEI